MGDSRVALRPAKPEFEEGLLFARYLDVAADGVFRFMLGKDADGVLAKDFLEPAHDLSYEHVTFAERDAMIIGMVSPYSSQQHRRSSAGPLIRAAGWRAARMAAVGEIAARLFRFLGTVPEGDFYVQAVAVDPQSRGGGDGAALIRQAEERARGPDAHGLHSTWRSTITVHRSSTSGSDSWWRPRLRDQPFCPRARFTGWPHCSELLAAN